MNISASAGTSLLDSVLSAESAREEFGVAVLKKAQDAAKQEGQAMVQLIEQSGPAVDGRHLDAYA